MIKKIYYFIKLWFLLNWNKQREKNKYIQQIYKCNCNYHFPYKKIDKK